jgi:flagellar biosynthetic protein FliQ
LISLFQAVTQLQEQTLTFVPKIAAMVVAAALFIPWVAEQMVAYAKDMLGTPPW